MSDSEKKIGLLAGSGEVPAYFAKQAAQRGIRITAVSFSDETHSKLEPLVERIFVHKDNPLKLELKHFLDCAANGNRRKLAIKKELNSLNIALQILSHFKSGR